MQYLARKLLSLLGTMLLVSFAAFFAFSLITGDPATAMLGTEATPDKVTALRAELGLDRPLPVQYADWLWNALHGDFGTSYHYRTAVSELLSARIPVTLCLSLLSFLLVVVISIPLGIRSVRYEGRLGRKWRWYHGIRTMLNQFLMAVPPFFSGILISWIFGILLRWFQPGATFPSLTDNPKQFFRQLLFPAAAIAIPRIAMTVRMLRSAILDEMKKDYVRTAIARGNNRSGVLYRHVLKNALAPVIAFLAQTLAEVVAGSIVVEQVFNVSGVGRLLLSSIGYRDWPVVEAIIVILALWVALAGTVSDLLSQWIDPRLRLGGVT